MFIASAFAQTTSGLASSPAIGIIVQIAPWLLIGIVFWFLLLRPQQVQQKQLKARIAAIKRGDKVVTAGGILGVVKKTTDGSANIDVEIAPGVIVSVVRTTITTVTDEKA
ncbi:preprotein translocase subunit YajC [Acidocella sp.]|uniref:preprotein translocase subunit YajC n=1 Tax=Acidocella sp. TaxID=50710 RepID=UPI00263105C5|nr:preprotein translocase subunit YajC [Acidocella sp.]